MFGWFLRFLLLGFYYRKIDSHRSLPSRKQNGNNSSWIEIYVTPCNQPPLPSGGRGLGRGWLYEPHEFDFPKPQNHPHPNLPPPDGGRNRIADTAKRSSENYDLWNFRRPRSSSNHAKHSLRCHSHIKKRSSETHLSDDSFLFQKRSASNPSLLLEKNLPVRRCRVRSSVLRWSVRPKRRAWNLSG